MHLKTLTLRGFKSFASATTLELEPGITCVVGPNGSGKSNVVDALAWVMGEQGAKTLRGGKMEDVIFAGTGGPGSSAGRAPLGRAEVVLTIDNSDGALPIDYTEVTITRTMFRNGGSDYAINGRPCRLLDVQELLSDSGIGREMHVIVGQGQLDSILHATPEERRGFIEEAAGVLKHRKRKEKALRKLESTEGNLIRLGDLLTELRRQLKPLGRQAEVARRAASVQSDLRDARARLLADDLVAARTALAAELEDEAALAAQRAEVEAQLEAVRRTEADLESSLRETLPVLAQAQEVWFALTGLRERLHSTTALAAERVRNGDALPEVPAGRDPAELLSEADRLAEQELGAHQRLVGERSRLVESTAARQRAEEAAVAEDRRVAALLRSAADRREAVARLGGQVDAKRSRVAAAGEELDRLTTAREDAETRVRRAERAFTALESRIAGLDSGERGLDAEHEAAAGALYDVEERLTKLGEEVGSADRERSALTARREALQLGLSRKDGAGALLAATEPISGLLGSVAALLSVRSGWETAVAAALGVAADAVAVQDVESALEAVARLKDGDLGRAAMVVAGAADRSSTAPLQQDQPAAQGWPELPDGAAYAVHHVECPVSMRGTLSRLLTKVAVVADLDQARAVVRQCPEVVAVTRDGDLVGAGLVAGGSASAPSLLEVQAALDETDEQLAGATHSWQRLGFDIQRLEQERVEARHRADVALAKLHESDATLAAVAEELAQHGAQARAARAEQERLERAIAGAQQAQAADLADLAGLEQRLQVAREHPDAGPGQDRREELHELARTARAAETDIRLALRSAEERARALAGRADSLRRTARSEQEARSRALAHRDQVRRGAAMAQEVLEVAAEVTERLDRSMAAAAAERTAVEAGRRAAEEQLIAARARLRELGARHDELVSSSHRDELARATQQLRLEQLAERSVDEVGVDAETLLAEYGPEVPVPVLITEDDGSVRPGEPVRFRRAEQLSRFRAAERALGLLGKVNPLALEEYAALEERNRFLTEQLEDLRRTRRDLLAIVSEVDSKVEEVLALAWEDVRVAFDQVFSRLFPGGEGRLLLTDPDSMLTTGVEVEARPPGKKVKRLSLLSGGERSLVAVAFLVALFKARPSPFYILDEVEAALDDTNLGRLLDIYSELRESSQLVVITHQKRTMEIADALYGVTMRGDGVSTVISQRLREAEAERAG